MCRVLSRTFSVTLRRTWSASGTWVGRSSSRRTGSRRPWCGVGAFSDVQPRTGLHGRPTFCYRSDMAKRRPQKCTASQTDQGCDTVLCFTVTLDETAPPIWRRIEIPATYDFWGLHVAIQDAMGWQIGGPDLAHGAGIRVACRPDSSRRALSNFTAPGHPDEGLLARLMERDQPRCRRSRLRARCSHRLREARTCKSLGAPSLRRARRRDWRRSP